MYLAQGVQGIDWEILAPVIFGMTLVLSTAAVFILRPLTKRLGELIETTSRNKQAPLSSEDVAKLTDVVGRLADRMESLEERQDFSESILTALQEPRDKARLAEPTDR
jgi:hypothetical protein